MNYEMSTTDFVNWYFA